MEFSGLGELSPARVSCSGEFYYRFIAILVINEETRETYRMVFSPLRNAGSQDAGKT